MGLRGAGERSAGRVGQGFRSQGDGRTNKRIIVARVVGELGIVKQAAEAAVGCVRALPQRDDGSGEPVRARGEAPARRLVEAPDAGVKNGLG